MRGVLQVDGRGDGAQRVHRAARHRVGRGRRHRVGAARASGCARCPSSRARRVGPTLLAAWALCRAVARHPRVNASWDEAARRGRRQALREPRHRRRDAARAASCRTSRTPTGSTSPRSATRWSALTDDRARRADDARPTWPAARSASPTSASSASTAARRSCRRARARSSCLGQVAERPWVVDGAVVPRSVCQLTLSFDHRFVDGELGSRVPRRRRAHDARPARRAGPRVARLSAALTPARVSGMSAARFVDVRWRRAPSTSTDARRAVAAALRRPAWRAGRPRRALVRAVRRHRRRLRRDPAARRRRRAGEHRVHRRELRAHRRRRAPALAARDRPGALRRPRPGP